MKIDIQTFIDSLILYDYILFTTSFVFFIIFIIFGIVLRRKIALAVVFILLAFGVLLLAPTIGRIYMHNFLFKNSITVTSQKRLEFTEAVVVKGVVNNESKFHFHQCKITANVHKVSSNELKNYLYQFKTLQKMSILEYDIAQGKSRDFKIIVEPFTYKRDYNITLGADCR